MSDGVFEDGRFEIRDGEVFKYSRLEVSREESE